MRSTGASRQHNHGFYSWEDAMEKSLILKILKAKYLAGWNKSWDFCIKSRSGGRTEKSWGWWGPCRHDSWWRYSHSCGWFPLAAGTSSMPPRQPSNRSGALRPTSLSHCPSPALVREEEEEIMWEDADFGRRWWLVLQKQKYERESRISLAEFRLYHKLKRHTIFF